MQVSSEILSKEGVTAFFRGVTMRRDQGASRVAGIGGAWDADGSR